MDDLQKPTDATSIQDFHKKITCPILERLIQAEQAIERLLGIVDSLKKPAPVNGTLPL